LTDINRFKRPRRTFASMEELIIPAGGGRPLPLALDLRRDDAALVVFVHGSGLDRHDCRSAALASLLYGAGFSTAAIDLLDEREVRERHNVFDVELQGERLDEALAWLRRHFPMPIGLFGAGVGAGVALVAAAHAHPHARAVVCCNGRPDTASAHLQAVTVPTLLIVAERDPWNELALERLGGEKALHVVPRPSAPFAAEELKNIADLAGGWFARHLKSTSGKTDEREDRLREHRPHGHA
jgi:putative phosphoribosyl transferase